ncbi:MAG: Biotin carboxyl carrier protein of acetyl-CoA carboxylase [Labilithrix sp.]|nr:Biotin carboxyl carrier protein of acetyl-CoA carboxylase [Labilithrix sp.]
MTTVDIDNLRALLEVLGEQNVAEFEHESGDTRIRIVRTHAAPAGASYSIAPHFPQGQLPQGSMSPGGGAPSAEAAADPDVVDVTSPFVGTFYRAATPDTPAFVEVGAVIRPGQTLCIVEAMKLMNEIEAEVSGTITEIYAQNGKSVEFGQKLFRIKKA